MEFTCIDQNSNDIAVITFSSSKTKNSNEQIVKKIVQTFLKASSIILQKQI